MYHVIEQKLRVGLLYGESGTGKSMLLQVLSQQARRTPREVVSLDVAGLAEQGLLWYLAMELRLAPRQSDSLFGLWRKIEDQLLGLRLSRTQTVLIFDHLDQAAPEATRIIDRLIRLDREPECMLTTIIAVRDATTTIASQPACELAEVIAPVRALDRQSTHRHVGQLMQLAGCPTAAFDDNALDHLYERTLGNPRALNRICDLALLVAINENRSSVDSEIVQVAAAEFRQTV
jgi:type II secretory pathway predicted ATPase ExeA